MGEAWTWKPELGPWRMDRYGYSETPSLVRVSTDGVPDRSRYDYWCDLAFSDFAPDRAREAAGTFQARATGLSYHRADFFETRSSAISGHRTRQQFERDGLGTISIGLVRAGRRMTTDRAGQRLVTQANGLFVYDASQPSQVHWTEHQASFIVLRRSDVQGVLGEDVPDASTLMARLAMSSMRHLVGEQLRRLGQYHAKLGTEAQGFLMEQSIQLMLFALAPRSQNDQPMSEDHALFHTALRYIANRLADPQLEAQRVAGALGVSRATLYRAFAAQDLGVAEAIREMRLDRARDMLEHAPIELSIGDIAQQCGLYDTVNFSRMFRRRFGVAPSEVRKGGR
ncbi:helix-turn-helix domain-containing protein [Devosia sp. FKR38]|uniref:helix-turn-helix domain-containing protein n=1 Tax=Devosia sp. FKR38 TaxID=2562312 RepID=UPI001484D877|nr:helix-turn-helix domain-containing protein [Devosia sp. FKR38]